MSRNEATTRTDLIDPLLASSGWGTIPDSRISREYIIAPGRIEGGGRPQRKLIADYVLYYRNRKVAVIEAKSEEKALTEGLGQAKNYADKLSIRFAYSTNGTGFYEVDMEAGTEGKIAAFPTPEVLWDRSFAGEPPLKAVLTDVPFEDRGGAFASRYYQDTSVERVLGAIAAGESRILLTLATGTGKTFIAFQIAWKLFQSKWNLSGSPTRRPRILFLADRNNLANQAMNDFAAFDDDAKKRIVPSEIRKTGAVPKNAGVFFTIFQTFMSGVDTSGAPAPYFGDYPADFFDLIIIDECHRGGANDESEWRGILEYFAPAVQLGLTATPRRTENVDTYAYFGDPVFVYSLKQGINDGYLTPFRVHQIQTTADEYQWEPDDDLVAGTIDTQHVYGESDFNRRIEIVERERARVKIFMDLIKQDEKTIVFCRTQQHALMVRDLVNQEAASTNPHYCVRVTADEGAVGDEHLLNFQDNEKTIPTVLTTSEKLSTGVDAKNVRNIVLMRAPKSMVEFKQIIGRGSRLFEGKEYFTVYDFVKAHYLFNDPEWDGDPVAPVPPGPPRGAPPMAPVGNPPVERIRIKLADGKERNIDFMVRSTFWSPDGRQITVEQFLTNLFGELPNFYSDENELRAIWSDPLTRIELLTRLEDRGFSVADLTKIQEMISAIDSDLYDVLSYISFAAPVVSRTSRASHASAAIETEIVDRQRAFIEFVLDHYVTEGVQELSPEKLPALLALRYGGVTEALNELGIQAGQLGRMFADFQRHLYAS